MGLQQTVAPTAYLWAESDIREHLRIDHSEEDGYLRNLRESATIEAENYLRRSLLAQTWRWTLDRFPPWEFTLPRNPVTAVSSITYVDSDGATQTLSSSLYRLVTNGTPTRLEPVWGETWPTIRPITDAITITFAAGYGAAASAVPMSIRQAVLLIIEQHYDAYRGAGDQRRMQQRQMAIERLLNPYRVKEFVS